MAESISADVVVYGATPSGIMAAIEAARLGKQVVLLEPTGDVGGIVTNGMGTSDQYNLAAVGGLPLEFYAKVNSIYKGNEAGNHGQTYEPHVALSAFKALLAENGNISVYTGVEIASVLKTGTTIGRLITTKGGSFHGKEYIDASYTGDLMAASKVSYSVGRESSGRYNEAIAGVGGLIKIGDSEIDPYIAPNEPSSGLIAHVTQDNFGPKGSADSTVMAYDYRLCFSSDPGNQIRISAPANYNPSEFALLSRRIAAASSPLTFGDILALVSLPNKKFDVNNSMDQISTDEVGVNSGYADGTAIVRREIDEEQKRYTQALLYFVATDRSIPESIQHKLNQFGLCKDEFTDNGGWPHQMYIREARRMVGAYVLTQYDLELKTAISDSIGVGGFRVDDHLHHIVDCGGAVCEEYRQGLAPQPYPIPYRILTPKASQATNLLVSLDVSASHVAFDSLRVEVTYMIMGQAAGAAAGLAIDEHTAVQQVHYGALSTQLRKDGAVLTPP